MVLVEMRAHLPEARVIHKRFYQYADFLKDFQVGFPIDKRWYVESTNFKDQSAWLKVRVGRKGRKSDLDQMDRYKAIVPFWLSTQFGEESKIRKIVQRTVNALTRKTDQRQALVDEVVGIAPYLEMRQDKDSLGDGQGDIDVGEACDPEITAQDLQRLHKLMVFAPHSYEGMKFFHDQIAEVMGVTATPLFAERIKQEIFKPESRELSGHKKNGHENLGVDPNNTRIVALDKGSLEQCIALTKELGLDPKDSLIAFDKKRKGQNMVGDHMLIYGDPKDMTGKDMIIYDDIIDTFGSMAKTCKSLREVYKCKSITVIGTHGVLSFPSYDNVVNALYPDEGPPIIDRLMMSDSLPDAKYALEEDGEPIPHVSIVPVGVMLGKLAHLFADSSQEAMMEHEYLRKFIFNPRYKEDVWSEFSSTIADPAKLHKAIGD